MDHREAISSVACRLVIYRQAADIYLRNGDILI